MMTVPLVLLAIGSVFVAWGAPPWQAHESFLGKHGGLLHVSEPTEALTKLNLADEALERSAEENHEFAGVFAIGVVGLGILFASLIYLYGVLDPEESKEQFAAVYRLLANKWYFDELYSAIVVRPALVVAGWLSGFDLRCIDGALHAASRFTVWLSWTSGRFDLGIIDGLVNVTARAIHGVADRLRTVQTGYLRSYVLFLVLAAVGLFLLLSWFVSLAAAR
jgi:NADH:ubiquinone oxidoreductase subunit 5 (subunit L)/multisubunit Na+/H+ antiporter MnhA subunit